jgi:hypothetical protein
MSRIERHRWLVRSAGQATSYLAVAVAVIELMRREGVVALNVFSWRLTLWLLAGWAAALVCRALCERGVIE